METTHGHGQTLARWIQESLVTSAGNIVFGMEDGTVSIFGLVFGVAASAPDSRAVLLAGATGAAAVSMMAGAYLDVATSQGKARVKTSYRDYTHSCPYVPL